MKILHVASEVAPLSQTGGLADVIGALPAALMHAGGNDVAVVSPLYRVARERAAALGIELTQWGKPRTLRLGRHSFEYQWQRADLPKTPPIYLMDAPPLFDRDGLYSDVCQRDYPDNPVRFAALCRAALDSARAILGGAPDILHAHDWQAGLAATFADDSDEKPAGPATVFTVHNLAYAGAYPKSFMTDLGIDWSFFTMQKLEFFDQISLLKAGIACADAVTTVSPSYAREIATPDFGCGLDSFIRDHAKRLTGIVNGIHTVDWNPATDTALPANYSLEDLSGKAVCRQSLAAQLEIAPAPTDLLVGVVSRFAEQKGLDLIAGLFAESNAAVPDLHFIVLGTGDTALEQRFRELSADPSIPVTAHIGFDVALARRIYAGCDAMLMPSRFEPCGLNQLYAMRYGTVPIVHAVGGLRDTVIDVDANDTAQTDVDKNNNINNSSTGICFRDADVPGLRWALGRATAMFRHHPEAWAVLRRNGMTRDSSWGDSAAQYLHLYRQILANRRGS